MTVDQLINSLANLSKQGHGGKQVEPWGQGTLQKMGDIHSAHPATNKTNKQIVALLII